MPEFRQFSEMRVTFDDRYAPVIITLFKGRADLDTARWTTEVQRQATLDAMANGHKIVNISDATHAERPPPQVRRYWADTLKKAGPKALDGTLSSYVVIANPLMRGVMTAIGWLAEEVRMVRSVPTLSEAIRRGLEDLDAAGVPRPEGLSPETYVPPSAPDTGADALWSRPKG